jgi:hypothetical protein
MRPDARHYTEALRSVRATLRAQEDARQPRPDASTQRRPDASTQRRPDASTQRDAATDDNR